MLEAAILSALTFRPGLNAGPQAPTFTFAAFLGPIYTHNTCTDRMERSGVTALGWFNNSPLGNSFNGAHALHTATVGRYHQLGDLKSQL
jgi:hypothetical protein